MVPSEAAATPIQAEGSNEGFRMFSNQGLSASQAALLMSRQEGGSVRVEQVASLIPAADGSLRAGLWIEVDQGSFETGAHGDRLIDVITYIFDESSGVVASRIRVVQILPFEAASISGFRFRQSFDLPTGKYRLRSLIADRQSDRFAVRESELEVLGPELPVVSAVEIEEMKPWMEIPFDPTVVGPQYSPATVAQIPVDGVWGVRLFVRGEGDVSLQLVDGEGRVSPVSTEWSYSDGPADWRVARSKLQGLAAFSQGAVLGLRAQIDDGEQSTIGPTARVLVSLGESGTDWTEDIVPAKTAEPVVSQRRTRGRSTLDRETLRLGLLTAVRTLSTDMTEGIRLLEEVERKALDSPRRSVEELGGFEIATYQRWTASEPEAIQSIVYAYITRYLHHVQNREYLLSTHCKRIALTLMSDLVDEAPLDLQANAADLWATLGGARVINGDWAGQDNLKAALRLSPDHEAALAILAWSLERNARYQELVRVIDSSTEAPRETRLRRALSNSRLGRERASKLELEELSQMADWVGLVATQELIVDQVRGNKLAEAELLLAPALKRFPRSSRLLLIQANLLDLQGRSNESEALLARVAVTERENARFLYSRKPKQWIDGLRLKSEAIAAVAVAGLASAMEGVE